MNLARVGCVDMGYFVWFFGDVCVWFWVTNTSLVDVFGDFPVWIWGSLTFPSPWHGGITRTLYTFCIFMCVMCALDNSIHGSFPKNIHHGRTPQLMLPACSPNTSTHFHDRSSCPWCHKAQPTTTVFCVHD